MGDVLLGHYTKASGDVLGGATGGLVAVLMAGGASNWVVVIMAFIFIFMMTGLYHALDQWTPQLGNWLQDTTQAAKERIGLTDPESENDGPRYGSAS